MDMLQCPPLNICPLYEEMEFKDQNLSQLTSINIGHFWPIIISILSLIISFILKKTTNINFLFFMERIKKNNTDKNLFVPQHAILCSYNLPPFVSKTGIQWITGSEKSLPLNIQHVVCLSSPTSLISSTHYYFPFPSFFYPEIAYRQENNLHFLYPPLNQVAQCYWTMIQNRKCLIDKVIFIGILDEWSFNLIPQLPSTITKIIIDCNLHEEDKILEQLKNVSYFSSCTTCLILHMPSEKQISLLIKLAKIIPAFVAFILVGPFYEISKLECKSLHSQSYRRYKGKIYCITFSYPYINNFYQSIKNKQPSQISENTILSNIDFYEKWIELSKEKKGKLVKYFDFDGREINLFDCQIQCSYMEIQKM